MQFDLVNLLTHAAALGSCLVAGIFFAFSNFVMPALARLEPRGGIAAMQAINVTVLNRWFLGLFFGTGVLSVVLALAVVLAGDEQPAGLSIAGVMLYLMGCLGVTMARNVPLNEALRAVRADSPEAEAVWMRYLVDWTFWNHVRTAASFAAAVLLVLATTGRG